MAFIIPDKQEHFLEEGHDIGGFLVSGQEKIKAGAAAHGAEIQNFVFKELMVPEKGGSQVLDGMDLGRIHDRLPVGAGHPDIEGRDGKIARQIPPGNVNAGQKF